MSEREAWIWMIAHAAWQNTTHKVGSVMMPVPRGTFFCTLRELQAAWGWRSDGRVRSFLARLKAEEMVQWQIVAKGNAQKTHITICNYSLFQDIERTKNAEENARATHGLRNKETSEPVNHDSEPIGSAVNGMGEDFAKQLFDRAVVFLGKHGTEERQARSFVGKLRKDHPDAEIFEAFTACGKAGAVDPIPWITARMKPPTRIRAILPDMEKPQ